MNEIPRAYVGGLETEVKAGRNRIAQLESQVAEMQPIVQAVKGLEEWAEKQTTGQAHIFSCWLTSSEPSALLPNRSISPAWEVRLEPTDSEEDDGVARKNYLHAAISAALAQVKEA